ncbi:MAG: hypothetical protein HY078_15135 [Elusimicrobia bacterium]|nr:hypothetical protein [Elusimicrobiota bacterium]
MLVSLKGLLALLLAVPHASYAASFWALWEDPIRLAPADPAAIAIPRDPTLNPRENRCLADPCCNPARRNECAPEPPPPPPPTHTGRTTRRRQPPIDEILRFHGLVEVGGRHFALVHGLSLAAGDSFNVTGYEGAVRVLRVDAESVTMRHDSRTFRLVMKRPSKPRAK